MASTESTLVYLDFHNRRRPFQLRLGEIEGLERASNAGIAGVATRLVTMQYRAGDVWDTLYFGLIGGGLQESDAAAILATYRDKPVGNYAPIAAKVIEAALSGVDEAEPGKDETAGSEPNPAT